MNRNHHSHPTFPYSTPGSGGPSPSHQDPSSGAYAGPTSGTPGPFQESYPPSYHPPPPHMYPFPSLAPPGFSGPPGWQPPTSHYLSTDQKLTYLTQKLELMSKEIGMVSKEVELSRTQMMTELQKISEKQDALQKQLDRSNRRSSSRSTKSKPTRLPPKPTYPSPIDSPYGRKTSYTPFTGDDGEEIGGMLIVEDVQPLEQSPAKDSSFTHNPMTPLNLLNSLTGGNKNPLQSFFDKLRKENKSNKKEEAPVVEEEEEVSEAESDHDEEVEEIDFEVKNVDDLIKIGEAYETLQKHPEYSLNQVLHEEHLKTPIPMEGETDDQSESESPVSSEDSNELQKARETIRQILKEDDLQMQSQISEQPNQESTDDSKKDEETHAETNKETNEESDDSESEEDDSVPPLPPSPPQTPAPEPEEALPPTEDLIEEVGEEGDEGDEGVDEGEEVGEEEVEEYSNTSLSPEEPPLQQLDLESLYPLSSTYLTQAEDPHRQLVLETLSQFNLPDDHLDELSQRDQIEIVQVPGSPEKTQELPLTSGGPRSPKKQSSSSGPRKPPKKSRYYRLHGRTYSINLETMHKLVAPLKKLSAMIGMEQVKESVVDQIIYYVQNFEGKNKNMLHTVIEGPPGVGKTELGKILAEIFAAMGVIPSSKVKFVKRTDLVGEYLGHTAHRTKEAIEEAEGGVLFIDEAYSLGNQEKKDSFAKEAIDTLNQYLSEYKGKMICIIAGYADELDSCFFSYNPGLKRRFPFVHRIEPYNAPQLCQIFLKQVRDLGWEIDSQSYNEKELIQFFKEHMKDFPHYGGDMENLLTHCKYKHSNRVWGQSIKKRKRLTQKDILSGFDRFLRHKKKEEERSISQMMMYT